MKILSPKLSITHTLQPGPFLLLHDLSNRRIFHLPQLRGREGALGVLLACGEEVRMAEKGADVFDAVEEGRGGEDHGGGGWGFLGGRGGGEC